jgi:CBS domain-containing protein
LISDSGAARRFAFMLQQQEIYMKGYSEKGTPLGKWECYKCGYVSDSEDPPEECPNCHYSVTFWIEHVEDRPSTVKDFMRTSLLKLDVNESAWEAAKLMKENDAGSVLVTVGGVVEGIVTERDILYKIAAEDLPASKVLLKKIMTGPIVATTSDTAVTEAMKLMAKHHIRRLVVMENGRPVGMLGLRSIAGGSFRVAHSTNEHEV